MYERQCTKCGAKVFVISPHATKVKCENCKKSRKVDYDTDEKVYCRLCKKARKRLDSHIKVDHNITVEQYIKQFPEAPIFAKNTQVRMLKSDDTKRKMSESAKDSWQDDQKRQNRINVILEHPPFQGHHHSEEAKQKIADSVRQTKGELHYLTVERKKQRKLNEKLQLQDYIICPLCLLETNDEVLSRIRLITILHLAKHSYTYEQFQKDFPDCKLSVESIGRYHSETISGENHFNYGKELSNENRQSIAQTLTKTFAELNLEKLQWEQNFDKNDFNEIIEKSKDLIDTDEYIYCKFCRQPFKHLSTHINEHKLTAYMYQQLFPNARLVAKNTAQQTTVKMLQTMIDRYGGQFGHSFGHAGVRKDIGHFVRSSVEANFCRILKLNNIRYEYEPHIFQLEDSEYCAYIPDIRLLDTFKIWPANSYVELKGDIDEKDERKIVLFKEQYKNDAIYLLCSNSHEWSLLKYQYKPLLPLWETSRQNIKITPNLYK